MRSYRFPPPALIDALACPDDGAHPLELSGAGLRCPHCTRDFRNDAGVLRMLPAAPCVLPDQPLVERERRRRDREARLYDRLSGLRILSLFEIPAALAPLKIRAADRVIDAGSGTGRFTLPAADCASLTVAVDHSLASLHLLRGKLAHRLDRVLLVQGDVSRLPVRAGWAAAALCCQVLEHLPSDARRQAAVAEIARVLQAGGRWAVSGYRHTPLLAREGLHSGEIFFRRFDRREFHELLSTALQVERLTGRLLYVLLAHGKSPAVQPKIDARSRHLTHSE